jgi:phosphohistidine phosphatase
MKLYLVRHGEALAADVDPQRGLSDEGRRDVMAVARLLRDAGVRPAAIEHSGKQRAAQTAAIFAELLGVSQCTGRAGLSPNDLVAPLVDEVATLEQERMIVSHLPFVGAALSALLRGATGDSVPVAFETATTVCVERIGVGAWVLRWMLIPALLQKKGVRSLFDDRR